jgi:hypothetical protein
MEENGKITLRELENLVLDISMLNIPHSGLQTKPRMTIDMDPFDQ